MARSIIGDLHIILADEIPSHDDWAHEMFTNYEISLYFFVTDFYLTGGKTYGAEVASCGRTNYDSLQIFDILF